MWPFHKNKSNESNKKKQTNVKRQFKKSEILWKKTKNQ